MPVPIILAIVASPAVGSFGAPSIEGLKLIFWVYRAELKLTDARSNIGCRAKLAGGLQRGCVGSHGLIAAVDGEQVAKITGPSTPDIFFAYSCPNDAKCCQVLIVLVWVV